MDVLISFNQSLFEDTKSVFLSKGEDLILGAIAAYSSLQLPELTFRDYPHFMTEPKEFLCKKLTNDAGLSIGGVKLNTDKTFEMLELPGGVNDYLESLAQKFAEFQNSLNWLPMLNIPITRQNLPEIFILTDTMEVELTSVTVNKIEARCKLWATSDLAKALFSLSNDILDSYTKLGLESLLKGKGESLGNIIDGVLKREHNGVLKPNLEGLVRLNHQ